MKLKVLLCAGALAGLASASGIAHAATYSTDFSTLCPFICDGTVPYSNGGVTVQYIGAPGQIWSVSQPTAPSGLSWYPNGGSTGYTDITLTGGGSFNSAELLVGSGWGGGGPQLDYQLLNGANVVATGDWGGIPTYTGFVTATFAGGPYTELRVQSPNNNAVFDPSNYEALAIGSITLTGGVPEPATWAMMVFGFGGLGLTLRSRRRPLGVSAAA